MRGKRQLVNGQIFCRGCDRLRPVDWFNRDRKMPLERGYRCRLCRGKKRKLHTVEPDAEVIPVSKIKPLKIPNERMAAGAWERVLKRAAICTPQEVVRVWTGTSYFVHHGAYSGLIHAARKLKIRVNIQHGEKEVYVTAR